METKNIFKKYHSRLVMIGLMKAIVCALIVGFAANFITAFATWFTDLNGLWISIGVGVAAFLVSVPIFYFTLFRPTTQKIAHLLDRLGLEERMVTMNELAHDDSYIAMLQREDAKQKLQLVNKKSLKLKLSRAVIVAVSVLAVFGVSMTTVTALSAEGLIDKPQDIIDDIIPPSPEDYVEITYVAGKGGVIEGEPEQIVLKGEDTEMVFAVPDDGWMFAGWDDGCTDQARADYGVTKSVTYTATFKEVGDGDSDDGDGDGEGEGQAMKDAPPKDDDGESNSNSKNKNNSKIKSNKPSKGSGGNDSFDNNSVVDGKTDYEAVLDYDGDMNDLAGDTDIPSDVKDLVGGYYDSMRP